MLSLPAGCSLFFHNHLLSGRTVEVRGAARQVGQSLTGARKRRGASHTASSQTPPSRPPFTTQALGCSPHGDPRGCGESSRPHPHQAWLTYLPNTPLSLRSFPAFDKCGPLQPPRKADRSWEEPVDIRHSGRRMAGWGARVGAGAAAQFPVEQKEISFSLAPAAESPALARSFFKLQ